MKKKFKSTRVAVGTLTIKEIAMIKCDGCGRELEEPHKMCPAHGTEYYMSGKVFTEDMEKELKEKENVIDKFEGKYRWLSNFYHCDVTYDGQTYKSSEAAYQASKTLDKKERDKFENVASGQAKKMGKTLELRPDWEEVKDDIMRDIVTIKFSCNSYLMQKLINTGDAELVEGNWWGDTYWGVCCGEGQNKLGKILMELRSGIIEDEKMELEDEENYYKDSDYEEY